MQAHKNNLLSALSNTDAKRFMAQCEPTQLSLSQVLCDVGQTIHDVYFPTDSFISLISQLDGRHSLEVGMVGSEGMLGVQLALGVVQAPQRAVVQGAGVAWRMDAAAFRRELMRSAALQLRILRYVAVLLNQLSMSAACLRFHEIGPRLSRRLLMSQDRARANEFQVTQEFMATMLGVRRVGVTVAASALQRAGLIEYHRGSLTVLDRPGLEAASCSCYLHNERAYTQLMGRASDGESDQRPAPREESTHANAVR